MLGSTKSAAVIPCFNEGADIAALVVALHQHLPLVMVVDDGSTDDTTIRAENAGAVVVRHERNLGKGAALRTGLSQIQKRGFEWAVTLDGDGQHVPDDLPAFQQCAEQTGASLVVGNRLHKARAIPWLRRQVNCWMSRKLSRLAGRCLPDTQCGFRLIHLETWASLSLQTEHFEIESEILMSFLAAEQRVEFVPIQVSVLAGKAVFVRWPTRCAGGNGGTVGGGLRRIQPKPGHGRSDRPSRTRHFRRGTPGAEMPGGF